MENSFMKNSLKKLEFPNQTPQRRDNHQATDFYSSQKGKYDNLHKATNQSVNIVLTQDVYNNQKEFYDNQVPIRVKSHEREDYHTYLNIKISLLTPSASHSQVLHFELTDETNHLFLYVLDMSETDFLTLKNEQNIIVDFQAFPGRLISILELVQGSANREDAVQFQCIFDIKSNGEANLNMVENNQFQALVHLSLRFREATDLILKNHLAHRLTNEKASNEDLRIRLEKLDEKYSSKTDDLERAQNELRRFQDEKEKQVNDLLNEEKRKINELNDQAIKKEIQITRAAEAERKELVNNYEKVIRDLQSKNESLTKSNQDLMEAKIQLEGTERELLSKLRAYERETNLLQKDIENIRGNNKELDSVRFSHEKALAEYRVRLESLEAQVRSKEEIIAKQSELLDNTTKQKAFVEENLIEAKKKAEKLEQKVALCSEEINKGNEIIEKLQAEAGQQKQKLKAKNVLVIQQEETIVKHQENADKYYKQTLDLQRDLNNKDFAIKELETQIEDFKGKITESQKTIESNIQMINWLNKCLNENQRPTGVRLPFTNKFQGAGSSQPSYSPYKAYSENPGMDAGQSLKYSTSINVDKYKPQQGTMNLDAGFSGTSTNPLSFSKTLGTFGGTMSKDQYQTADFDKDNFNKVSTLQGLYDGTKENVDYTNRSLTSANAMTSHKTHHNMTGNEFTSTSSIDISTYSRNIQPIKYQDPHK